MEKSKINMSIPNYVNIPDEHFENIKEICEKYGFVGIISYDKEKRERYDNCINGYNHIYRTGFHSFSYAIEKSDFMLF